MKNSFFIKIVLVLLAVMILGQILGSLAIRYFFLNTKVDELSPQLSDIADEIALYGTTSVKRNDFILKAYDLYKNEIDIGAKKDGLNPMFTDEALMGGLLPYMPKVLTGQNVAHITEIDGLPATSIIIGVPIVKDEQIIGTVFLMKPASDFRSALNGFYLVFFCISLLSGAVILTIFALYLKVNKRLEQTRRDYVANISHELRTPISSVKALSETLCDNMITDENDKARYYHIIHSESVRLERLISDMLELSRLQSGKLAFKKSHFSGADMMAEIIEKYSVLADDMDIAFSVSESAKNLPVLFSNMDRIIQVLNILLDNAFKFCGDEGTVFINAEQTSKNISLSIANNGETIAKEDLPLVFDRFYKSEKARESRGSGLGLAIAKEILNNLGEEITVTSEQGKFTTFTFTIRL